MRATKQLMTSVKGQIHQQIEKKLSDALKPVHLQILNDSHMHNVPKNSETHFKVIVISSAFEGQSLLARHRCVNELLKEEFDLGLHALSISSKTPEQWAKNNSVKPSPACLGGMARENQNK